MDYLHHKYLRLVSNHLRNFKEKSSNLFNFSCPYCNDSKNNKFKARGYIYDKKGKIVYYCHNCTISRSYDNFLKELEPYIYNDYVKERLLEKRNPNSEEQLLNKIKKITKKRIKVEYSPLDRLTQISLMKPNHPCVQYVASRKLPIDKWKELYYCPEFYRWTNDILELESPKFDLNKLKEQARLVIPLINKEGIFHAFQGRSLDEHDNLRYITIVIDNDIPNVWGLNHFNMNNPSYIVEGPLDGMFLPNCLSSVGNDIVSALMDVEHDKKNMTVIYDNERRKKETIKKMKKAINAGYAVCFWPDEMMGKDINKMIQNGYTVDNLKEIIDTNTYRDLKALNTLQQWKKVKE